MSGCIGRKGKRETQAQADAKQRMKEASLIATAERTLAKSSYGWKPIETAPRDHREMLGLWVDIDGQWNVNMIHWGGEEFMTQGGMLLFGLVGWMPRPALPPGKARFKG